ncbi:hypothetical protein F53441_8994 [Fusarium austroafricanum]|uniref:Uncharacterized protein n=1 Tax=Fusarium austroafricanum TaxID=2364996 RepID=A0A8H4NTU4_9HYPO|nr:hypothetical protein F53441_8994 [Fusarium austroafricanum]
MLHNVCSDPDVIRVIRYAASNPEAHLHRFAIFPAYESHQDEERANGNGPQIITEELVLDYINSKRPQHQDPFALVTID